jgi:PAS domain S-box-containing protein
MSSILPPAPSDDPHPSRRVRRPHQTVPSSNAIPFHASLQEEWDITLPDETLFRCEPTDPPRLISIGASVNWITGWQKQELEAHPAAFPELALPEDRAILEHVLRSAMSDPMDAQLRWLHRDGSIRWVEMAARPVLDADERVVEIRGSIRDVTDRVNQQINDRVRLEALRAAANAVVITDARGNIEWINPAFTTLTGYEKHEVIGKNPSVLRSGEHDEALYKDLWTTIQAGNVWKGELVNRRKDGTTYHEEMTITPVRDFTGTVSRFIAIKQDVTDRRTHEDQLIQATKKAQEAASFKSNLLNNMSHEVMTPLTAILGLADILAEEGSPEQQEFIAEVRNNGLRLKHNLSNILNLSRLQSGDYVRNPEWIVPRSEVERVVASFRPAAEAKGLVMRVSGDRTKVWLDPELVKRIMTNLLSNAIKFTEEGIISITCSVIDDELTLVVTDTGCGVEPAFIPYMFDEFRQESQGLDREHEGNGIGLSVVRRLVRLSHGSTDVVSQKGLGTSVTVRLPNFPPAERQDQNQTL